MRSRWIMSLWVVSSLLVISGKAARAQGLKESAIPGIRVLDGFQVEVAAKAPLVRHPMMAGFDGRGRLFIAESAGKNLRRPVLEKELPNFIRMLEDTDKDGKFDKSTIFADKMTLPMGALWYRGALYVAAPPSIWRFEDTDGDGVADRREELVNKFGYSGNAASVHGCFLGPCGRLYWCDGRHGHEFKTKDGKVTSQGKAARIFSCLPDGTDVQVHCGGGMDNPVEIDFLPTGEMLGTVNIMFRRRGDCLVHWMHGGVYPRYDQNCVNEFPRTGDLLGPVHDLGHIGISGMMRYRTRGPLENNVFIAEFNSHKVSRAQLSNKGATFSAKVSDFLVSSNNDFHPTDVLEDADGSLLVIDTGGWFRIGCPTSQIAKPSILGAIYRVRRTDADRLPDPRGQKLNWEKASADQLVARLHDRRFSVRERAVDELALRGEEAVPALYSALRGPAPLEATWALARQRSPQATAALRRALVNKTVRTSEGETAIVHALGRLKDTSVVRDISRRLRSTSPALRRTAATALGRIGDARATSHLRDALARESIDEVERHAITYALLEIGDAKQMVASLKDKRAPVRHGALLVADQLDQNVLQATDVLPLLTDEDLRLRELAAKVVASRAGWEEQTLQAVARMLRSEKSDERRLAISTLLAMGNAQAVHKAIAIHVQDDQLKPATRGELLGLMAQLRPSKLPDAWSKLLGDRLKSGDPSVQYQAVNVLAQVPDARFRDDLLRLAGASQQPESLGRIALIAAASQGAELNESLFQVLLSSLSDKMPASRLAAARALSQADLTAVQQRTIARRLEKLTPLEIPALFTVFDQKSVAEDVRSVVLKVVTESPRVRASLSDTAIEKFVGTNPGPAAQQLLEIIKKRQQSAAAELKAVSERVGDGEVARGRAVFFGRKASCSTCHQIRTGGGRIGPDLTQVAKRRTRRDLLEAIALPSASLSRGFESYSFRTSRGRIISGLIQRDMPGELLIRTTEQRDETLRRQDIESMTPSKLSVMPAGIHKQLSDRELSDLLAFLMSLK